MNNLTTLQSTNDAILEIEKAFFDIPFENSDFQNEVFVLAAQITPERAYRALGLRMHAKLRALRENYYAEKKRLITLGELAEKVASPSVSKWDKLRAEVEIEEINASVYYTEKLKNDAIRELECLYKHFKALPKFTREQFELGEQNHFEQRLVRNANGITGPSESLANIANDIGALLSYEDKVRENDIITTELLSALRLEMSNQLQNQAARTQLPQIN
jgi:hypothetical protein